MADDTKPDKGPAENPDKGPAENPERSSEGRHSSPKIPTFLTSWSLIGLGAGLLLGVMGNLGWAPWVIPVAGWLKPIGGVWIDALQLIVLPLIITQVLSAIVGSAGGPSIASIGGRILLLFLLFQAGFGSASMAISQVMVAPLNISTETVTALREQLSSGVPDRTQPTASRSGGVVPTNIFRALAEDNVLAVILFTVVFALGVTRLPQDHFNLMAGVFRASAGAMMNVMVWVLWGTPVAVFAIILGLAVGSGWGAAGVLGAYVIMTSAIVLLMTGVLYVIAVVIGRVSLGAFQRSLSPAQMVAVSTRSSIATVPALIEGAEEHLHLPAAMTGFALPLTAAVFKVTPLVSGVFLAVFIAHVFGVPLTMGQMAYFLAFKILLSVTVMGLPSGGDFNTLPAYTAVGLPVEGIVIAVVARSIPDIFMTLMNTTSYMTILVLLARGKRP